MKASLLWQELRERFPGFRIESGETAKGIPDSFLVMWTLPCFLEIKAERDTLSGHQRRFIDRYQAFIPCFVWRGRTVKNRPRDGSRYMRVDGYYQGRAMMAEATGRPREAVDACLVQVEAFLNGTGETSEGSIHSTNNPCA